MRSESYSRAIFYPLFLLHRFLFIYLVFAFSFSGLAQALLMVAASAIFLFYLFKFSPFIEPVDHFLTLFSTVLLILLYCFCFAFALGPSLVLRETLGFVFVGLVLLFFGVNISVIIAAKIVQLVRSRKRKARQKRERQRLKEFETAHSVNTLSDTSSNIPGMLGVPRNWGTVTVGGSNLAAISAVRKRSDMSDLPLKAQDLSEPQLKWAPPNVKPPECF